MRGAAGEPGQRADVAIPVRRGAQGGQSNAYAIVTKSMKLIVNGSMETYPFNDKKPAFVSSQP
jgi:hypothetical protein